MRSNFSETITADDKSRNLSSFSTTKKISLKLEVFVFHQFSQKSFFCREPEKSRKRKKNQDKRDELENKK